LLFFGAETGHNHSEALLTILGTSPTLDTAVKRSGTSSFKCDSTAGSTSSAIVIPANAATTFIAAMGVKYFASCWFYIPSATGLPTTTNRLVNFVNVSTLICAASLTPSGKIRLVDAAAAQIGSDSSATVTTDTWYHLSLATEINTGSTDHAEVQLNGVSVASTTTAALAEVAPTHIRIGFPVSPGVSKVVYLDDIVINDDNGSVHNTWPGDDKVVLLLPTADSARDAGWFAGLSATTNLWDAVDNIPPIGIAPGSATATSQITNAASTTTDVYSATMKTYTAAGIASGDTVTAVQGIVEAANGANSADTIGVSIFSNPAVTEVLGSIPSTGSAYPSQWFRLSPSIAENPSLTLGTAPVMRVRKNLAATRRHTVCFMGMYVSYTVAPAAGTRLRFILAMLLSILFPRRKLWQPLT
jgi:hypothetical protein